MGEYRLPERGEDEEIDAAFEKAWETLQQAGEDKLPIEQAESLGISVETLVHRMIALRLLQYGRKEIPTGIDIDPILRGDAKPQEPAKPSIDLEATREELSLDDVKTAEAGYWYDPPEFVRFLDTFVELSSRGLTHGGLVITGPAGTGKTQSVYRAAERLGRELYKMDIPTVTDPQKWVGRREITDQGTTFIESDFLRAVEAGKLILLDDLTRIPPFAANLVMSLLDSTGTLSLSDMGMTIRVPAETVFIATANIGTQFGGTYRMDSAHRERFPFSIERGFPPADEEAKVVSSQSGCPLDKAAFMVGFADRTRQLWQTGDLMAPVSTRTLVAGGKLVAAGFSVKDALEYTAIGMANANSDGTAGAKSEKTVLRNLLTGLGA